MGLHTKLLTIAFNIITNTMWPVRQTPVIEGVIISIFIWEITHFYTELEIQN